MRGAHLAMAEDADAAALAALSADVAARPQSTLQSLAVLWDELGYDAHVHPPTPAAPTLTASGALATRAGAVRRAHNAL